MARFGDLGIESGAIIGKGIEIEELFGKRILIEKTKISKSKFTGKNNSGLRLQMQVVLASFNECAIRLLCEEAGWHTRRRKALLLHRVGHPY